MSTDISSSRDRPYTILHIRQPLYETYVLDIVEKFSIYIATIIAGALMHLETGRNRPVTILTFRKLAFSDFRIINHPTRQGLALRG